MHYHDDSKEQRKRENTVFCHVVSLKCIADFFNKYCYDALLVEYLVQLQSTSTSLLEGKQR